MVMRASRVIIATLLIAFMAIGLWVAGRHRTPAQPGHHSVAPDHPAAPPAAAVQSMAGSPASNHPASPAAERYRNRIPAALRERLRRRRELENQSFDATDLYAFVQSILLAARGGDVEAQVAIADALSECGDVETSKHGPKKQTYRELLAQGSAPPRMLDMARQQIARCEQLARAPADEVGTEEDWRRRAALGGHASSMLDLAAMPDSASADEVVAEMHEAIASGDPDVLLGLITSYNFGSNRQQRQDAYDVFISGAVMTLVRCDLGEDCSRQGLLFRSSCQWTDCGTAANEIDLVRRNLTDEQWAQAQQRAETLIAEFYSGRYDWPEAQAYENTIREAAKTFAANRRPSPASSAGEGAAPK